MCEHAYLSGCPTEVAYPGETAPDLPCMNHAYLSGCPTEVAYLCQTAPELPFLNHAYLSGWPTEVSCLKPNCVLCRVLHQAMPVQHRVSGQLSPHRYKARTGQSGCQSLRVQDSLPFPSLLAGLACLKPNCMLCRVLHQAMAACQRVSGQLPPHTQQTGTGQPGHQSPPVQGGLLPPPLLAGALHRQQANSPRHRALARALCRP